MKKTKWTLIAGVLFFSSGMVAQEVTYSSQMKADIIKLDSAKTPNDYQVLGNDFQRLANFQKNNWLPYYYAAFCNAEIGFIYFADKKKTPNNIESFSDLCETQIKTALSLIDTNTQKEELSEIYCVMSMMYRTRIFINPMSNGRKYGPVANLYIVKAKLTDTANARANYLDGWLKYYTPKLWGGDKKKAKELLEKSIQQLAAAHPKPMYPEWGKEECTDILKQYK